MYVFGWGKRLPAAEWHLTSQGKSLDQSKHQNSAGGVFGLLFDELLRSTSERMVQKGLGGSKGCPGTRSCL